MAASGGQAENRRGFGRLGPSWTSRRFSMADPPLPRPPRGQNEKAPRKPRGENDREDPGEDR